mgnify:FL=1
MSRSSTPGLNLRTRGGQQKVEKLARADRVRKLAQEALEEGRQGHRIETREVDRVPVSTCMIKCIDDFGDLVEVAALSQDPLDGHVCSSDVSIGFRTPERGRLPISI